MRDSTIIGQIQRIIQYIAQVEQSARLGITGEAVRAQAFQNLMIQKGYFTEQELNEAIGAVIKKANEAPAPTPEAPKTEIITPTTEQVQAIENSKNVDVAPADPTKLAVEGQ